MADHGEVMGDEEHGEARVSTCSSALALAVVPAEALEEVEDLGLDREVERRQRLVGDEEAWAHQERPGDSDALQLAAGELAGIAGEDLAGEAHLFEGGLYAMGDLAAARAPEGRAAGPRSQHLSEGRAHGQTRVERGEGVLEDDLRSASEFERIGSRDLGEIAAHELDRARVELDQAEEETAERGLAAARLADEAVDLALADLDVDSVDRAQSGLTPA
jgi:hypothetical protein